MLVGSNLEDSKVQEIAKKTIADADNKGDGKLNFEAFCKVGSVASVRCL